MTLSSHPLLKSPEISNAGKHLSAAEFHSILQNAGIFFLFFFFIFPFELCTVVIPIDIDLCTLIKLSFNVEIELLFVFPGNCQELSSGSDKELILLDARNLYETRIGKFHAPDVKTLDPAIRQYSDLPSWIDDYSEQLRGNNILM